MCAMGPTLQQSQNLICTIKTLEALTIYFKRTSKYFDG